MKTIILGKEGNQPFPIKNDFDGVSRRHAKITINDYGDWFLEDLNSMNGTYVRDENTGDLVPVTGKKQITPMSFILLGPDNSKGCGFFAKQAVSYGDFTEERKYLFAKEQEFEEKLDKIEKWVKWQGIIKTTFPVVMLVFASIIIPEGTMSQTALWIGRLFAAAVPTVLFLCFYNPADKKKTIKDLREKFSHCPNPCCSNKQTSKEIKNFKCSKCKK